VKDGRYVAALTLFDAAGNPVRRFATVTVDTTAPVVRPAASAKAFSPNGDGLVDTTVLSFTSTERATGTAKLFKGTKVVRSWKVTGTAAWKATWDGRRADGTWASDGVYALRIRVRDAGGNVRSVATRVIIDRALRGMAWAGDFFPQDGDPLKAASALSFRLTRDARTTLRIENAKGAVVRTAWSGRTLADGTRTFRWNGKRDDGTFAPQGRYLATLRVKGRWATIEYRRWVWAAAFSVTANRSKVVPGQTLTVRFRSVEPLSTKPRVTFTQPGRAGVTATATKRSDGSWKAAFKVRSGRAGTATVKIGASDREGGSNGMRIAVRVAS
jgi:flagellar hook assembly protein FlgD